MHPVGGSVQGANCPSFCTIGTDYPHPKAQARTHHRGLRERIKSGDVSLGELAQTESDCSSARKRGSRFFGRGDIQKEFEDAAFALQPGQISSVVDTASGLHLIQRFVCPFRFLKSALAPRSSNPGRLTLGRLE